MTSVQQSTRVLKLRVHSSALSVVRGMPWRHLSITSKRAEAGQGPQPAGALGAHVPLGPCHELGTAGACATASAFLWPTERRCPCLVACPVPRVELRGRGKGQRYGISNHPLLTSPVSYTKAESLLTVLKKKKPKTTPHQQQKKRKNNGECT